MADSAIQFPFMCLLSEFRRSILKVEGYHFLVKVQVCFLVLILISGFAEVVYNTPTSSLLPSNNHNTHSLDTSTILPLPARLSNTISAGATIPEVPPVPISIPPKISKRKGLKLYHL